MIARNDLVLALRVLAVLVGVLCLAYIASCGGDPHYDCRAPESYVDAKTGETETGIPCVDKHGYTYVVESDDYDAPEPAPGPVEPKPYG